MQVCKSTNLEKGEDCSQVEALFSWAALMAAMPVQSPGSSARSGAEDGTPLPTTEGLGALHRPSKRCIGFCAGLAWFSVPTLSSSTELLVTSRRQSWTALQSATWSTVASAPSHLWRGYTRNNFPVRPQSQGCGDVGSGQAGVEIFARGHVRLDDALLSPVAIQFGEVGQEVLLQVGAVRQNKSKVACWCALAFSGGGLWQCTGVSEQDPAAPSWTWACLLQRKGSMRSSPSHRTSAAWKPYHSDWFLGWGAWFTSYWCCPHDDFQLDSGLARARAQRRSGPWSAQPVFWTNLQLDLRSCALPRGARPQRHRPFSKRSRWQLPLTQWV